MKSYKFSRRQIGVMTNNFAKSINSVLNEEIVFQFPILWILLERYFQGGLRKGNNAIETPIKRDIPHPEKLSLTNSEK